MDTEIHTDRLKLRRSQPADLDEMHTLVSDFEVARMTATWPYPPDRTFTADRCAPMDPADGMAGPVFHGDVMVAMIGAYVGGLGYAVARPHWGNGYATEIGLALIPHVWATYDWPALTAEVMNDNPASARVLQKLGFTETGPTTCKSIARGPGDYPARAFILPRP